MLETGQPIYPHTHRRANDTLSRFTFFTWLSRQSWKSSLPLTERQVSAEHSHGRLWHRNFIKYSHSAGTHPCVYLFFLFIYFFPGGASRLRNTAMFTATRICMFIIYFI